MSNLKELIAQRQALDAQIDELRKQEREEAVSKVRAMVQEFGLTQADVLDTPRKPSKAKKESGKIAAKYRDPVSGKEWSGRGISPKWMAGKSKEEFLISPPAAL